MILVVFWDLCQPQSIISHLWRHFENCQCLNIKVNNPWRVRFICANGNVFNYSNNWHCILLCYQAYIVSCSDWYRRKIACERYCIILKITWFLSQYMLFNAGGLRRGKINDAASVWFNINIPKMYYRLNINGKMHIIQVCMPKCFISMGFLVKVEFVWCYFLVSEVTVLGFLFRRSLFGGKEQEVTPKSIKNTAVEKYDHLMVQSAFNQNFTCVFMLLFFPVPCSQVGTRSFVCSLMFPPSIRQRRSCAFKIKWLIELFSVACCFLYGTVYSMQMSCLLSRCVAACPVGELTKTLQT